MLSLPKHLARLVEWLSNGASEMLRQAQHDGWGFTTPAEIQGARAKVPHVKQWL